MKWSQGLQIDLCAKEKTQNVASDHGLHFLHIGISFKTELFSEYMYIRHPIKKKWTCPIDKDWRIH